MGGAVGVKYTERKDKPKQLLKVISPASIKLVNSSIANLHVTEAIYILSAVGISDALLVRDSVFFNNSGSFRAPLNVKRCNLTMRDTTFVNNHAAYAAALVLDNATALINHTSLNYNGGHDTAAQVE